ncbi:MAG: thioredoxin [Oscillospiraceae bacterium]|nr:thioredoxin [Oscillospiraceae bacterium]
MRWALLGVAVFLFVFGLFTGGTQDVLTKAVNICTECVGLG